MAVSEEQREYVTKLQIHGMSKQTALRMLNAEFKISVSQEDFDMEFSCLWAGDACK